MRNQLCNPRAWLTNLQRIEVIVSWEKGINEDEKPEIRVKEGGDKDWKVGPFASSPISERG